MKRFFLALYAIFLIVLSAVLYDTGITKAYSVYDQAYRTTDDIYYQGYTCDSPKSAVNWVQILSDYNSYFAYGNNQQVADEQRDDVFDKLNETFTRNGAYAVTQSTNNNGIVYVHLAPAGGTLKFGNFGSGMYPDYSVYIESPEPVTVVAIGFSSSGTNAPCEKPIYAGINVYERPGTGLDPSARISNAFELKSYFAYNFDIEYPEDYEGTPINDIDPGYTEQKILTPQYSWKVDQTGNLTITYTNNVQPTLTGFIYPVIERMTDDWLALADNLQANEGWRLHNFNRTFTLPSAGYYMFRMDYDDTFESPPWEENANNLYEVKQVFVQIYWDGHSLISGTTVGCTDDICNPLKQKESDAERILGSIGIPVYGLQQLILSPLGYLAELSTSTNNCTPLTLPLGFGLQNAYLPCMTPIYRDHFGTILTIYQTILIGLFAYYVGLRSFGNIKDMSNPRNDQIETAKL